MKRFERIIKTKKKHLLALVLAAVTVLTGMPVYQTQAASGTSAVPSVGEIHTIADPESLHTPAQVYGNNTYNAGKITVGKSVSDTGFAGGTLDGVNLNGLAPQENNFLITLSQSAQIMGIAKEIAVPVDVVFVLDTSASMDENDRYSHMVTAANAAISSLMSANTENRVGVVAFSSSGNYGGGTSDGASANVLSNLAHYTGDAATNHLQMVNSGWNNNSRNYIAGRNASGDVGGYRHGYNGGTNIQAGVALGASLLMNANPSVEINGQTHTRIPFLVILSDGAPTYITYTSDWYDIESVTTKTSQLGPGSDYYAGNGFLPALTAAYFKGKITEHYFGASASEDYRCEIYTVGVDIESASTDSGRLARLTLDPAANMSSGNNTFVNNFNTYWNNYKAGNGFNITVNRNSNANTFSITSNSIAATSNSVNGISSKGVRMYQGGIGYNDAYFDSDSNDLSETFEDLVELIQIKAISLPTEITTTADFSGYVHFNDPIGEYMEVKKIHGIVADGLFFRGVSAAQNLTNFNDSDNDDAFDAEFTYALNNRLNLAGVADLSNAQIDTLLQNAVDAGQLYHVDSNNYSNSFCWWGTPYENPTTGEQYMQYISFAPGDSVEAIEQAIANGSVPENAVYVCRSYYYYGTAGGAVNPTEDALLFSIRVERELEAPYKQNVYVGIPGSLLNTERVLITEKTSGNYEAVVNSENPVRIIYEVGLREDINEFNVADIVSKDYAEEAVENGGNAANGSLNYDAATGTYYFYTNDWDRSKTIDDYTRAMTYASFEIDETNEYYTYTEDRLLYEKINDAYRPVTSGLTAGETYFYERIYYDWSNNIDSGVGSLAGTTYKAEKTKAYVAVTLSEASIHGPNPITIQKSDGYYIKAGTRTAASLSAVDNTSKATNNSGTSAMVATPVKAEASATDAHYKIYLGNNGRLALRRDTVADKSVAILPAAGGAAITDADGHPVTIGDKLTYSVTAKNTENTSADITITDTIPRGTMLVDAGNGTENGDTITWTLNGVPVDGERTVSFTVQVTEAAVAFDMDSISNQATAVIGGNSYTTNRVTNPSYGKTVSLVTTNNSEDISGGVKVGDELNYIIEYPKPETTPADITIVDHIPAGTSVYDSNLLDGGNYDKEAGTITWDLTDVTSAGSVSFVVKVNEHALNTLDNKAEITIGNNIYTTNTTSTAVKAGSIRISKVVTNNLDTDLADEVYTLALTSRSTSQASNSTVQLNGTFQYDVYEGENTTAASSDAITFTDGRADLTIRNGQTIEIKGLPQGVQLLVQETHVTHGSDTPIAIADSGYVASYMTNNPTPDTEDDTTYGVIAVLADTNQITVTNTYAANPITYRLVGQKTFTTNDTAISPVAFTFAFGLWNSNKDATAALADTPLRNVGISLARNADATADIIFPDKNVTIPEKAYYIVKEMVNSPITGVTYDAAQYHVMIETYDDGAGSLKARYQYRTRTGDEGTWSDWSALIDATLGDGGVYELALSEGSGISFTNSYIHADSTNVTLQAAKELTGRALKQNEFGFAVYTDEAGTGSPVATGYNNADGSVVFTPIGFTNTNYNTGVPLTDNSWVHTYYMKEIVKADGTEGITYSKDIYKVEVTVVLAEGEEGTLETSVVYTKKVGDSYDETTTSADAPIFTNTYTPTPTTVSLAADKTLNGMNLTAGQFSFTVKDANDPTGAVISSAVNQADGIVSFSPISIIAGGTYYYLIEEVPEQPSEYAYGEMTSDTTMYLAVVKVTDNTLGVLTASAPTYYKWNGTIESTLAGTPTIGAGFTNTYVANAVTVDLSTKIGAVKNVTGPYTMQGGEFTFEIVNSQGGVVAAGTNGADGRITFNELTFGTNGYYNYTIKEVVSGDGMTGMTYDDRTWSLRVLVKYHADTGKLAIENMDTDVVVLDSTGVPSNPEFENTYEPVPVNITINASKLLTGGTARTLKADEFNFVVYERSSEGKITVLTTARNDADGNVNLSFNEDTAGAHTYYVREIIPTAKMEGVTYDSSEASVNVTVVDVNGELTVEGSTSPVITSGKVFSNHYYGVPTPEIVTFTLNKVLHNAELSAGTFEFELLDVQNGNAVLQTVKNDENGKITFEMPQNYFAAPGQYSYIVREKAGTLADIEYDTSEILITVDVSDNLAGKLIATVSYPQDITFENIYHAPEIPVPQKDDGNVHKLFSFTKRWNDNDDAKGIRPDKVVVEAYQDGVYVTDIIITAEESWVGSAVLLYAKDDHVYEWTIKEKNVPEGYVAEYNQETLTVTNTLTELYKEPINSPQTGDTNPIGLLLSMLGISMLGMISMFLSKKHSKR